ncbi:MAG: DUF4142 domain-containing protein [Reyranellaceae bacterium]
MTRGEFILRVTMTDLFEVRVAQIALRRGGAGEVQAFEQTLLTDHALSQESLGRQTAT